MANYLKAVENSIPSGCYRTGRTARLLPCVRKQHAVFSQVAGYYQSILFFARSTISQEYVKYRWS